MSSINDLVLRIHMTFLNNKNSVEWVETFDEEIAPLSQEEFEKLVDILNGVAEQEQANYADAVMQNAIPEHLQRRAGASLDFSALIEKLQEVYNLKKR